MNQQQQSENEYIQQRRQHLQAIKEAGINPFPVKFDYDITAEQIKDIFEKYDKEELESLEKHVKTCGRIMSKRMQGRACFMHISYGKTKLQLYIRQDKVGKPAYKLLKKIEVGDFIGFTGTLFRTRTEELTVMVEDYTFLSKAIRPMPEKWHGLKDKELRYRMRYLDLLSNDEVRQTFILRSALISETRKFFEMKEYMEVETPMMQLIPGGAAAKPFITHHNALDLDLYLRIAPELFLKRLIVGGFPRVFEINRNFRNEGVDTQHNPEFTMVEFYEAYADLRDMMTITEELFTQLCDNVLKTRKVKYGDKSLSFETPFRRLTMREAIAEYGGIPREKLDAIETLLPEAKKLEIEDAEKMSYGKLLSEVFETVAEEKLIQPTFITEYPIEVSPLTKSIPEDDRFVDRFELFIAGMELANAYSELNDPEEQLRRFQMQISEREKGDDEAQMMDRDFLTAMEHGMPPTGGQGIGIDRLVMVLTNSQSIRDVILFPYMRPRKDED
ncbi:MAG: lysine--tRNA ligase [Acidobacteria bacterium]|nr:lysine--tRNA ligase [Acidobacteriota bacterium]